jgi:processive 1,2-diacylglycerol beta-glucosyltransferase
MGELKKVLVLSVKAGAGHLRAALAVEEAFKKYHPDIEVKHIDALEYTNPAFRSTFSDGYNILAKNLPSIWGLMYESLEHKESDSKIKWLIQSFDQLNSGPLRKMVADYNPDAIVSTHFLPQEALSRKRVGRKLSARFHVVITDYDIHSMWVRNITDVYYVASDEMRYALDKKKSPDAEVRVTGIPVMSDFTHEYPSIEESRKLLGLNPDRPTVLLASGGFGYTPLDKIVPQLLNEIPNAQFLTVAGKNEKMKNSVETACAGFEDRVKVYGFVDNFHELMAASDFIITKAGGLTSSESLAMAKPMIIVKPLPGQEERNTSYLLEKGAAMLGHTPSHLVYKASKLIRHPEILQQMQKAASKIAKPDAAKKIVDAVVADLRKSDL